MTRVEEFYEWMRERDRTRARKALIWSVWFTVLTVLFMFMVGQDVINGWWVWFASDLLILCLNAFGAIDARWRYVRLRA